MLTLAQGNTYSLTYNIRNMDGSIKPLSGTLTLKYELAKRVNSTPLIQFTEDDVELEIADAANGVVRIKLNPDKLNALRDGVYYHELWQENALGEKSTLMHETLEIEQRLITG